MQTPMPTNEPLWTDVAGVWIAGGGAAASFLVAAAALVLSIFAFRVPREDARREARANWASDMQVWLDRSEVHMLLPEAAVFDEDWVADGNLLMARAGTLASPGAESLMMAATKARAAMGKLSAEDRLRSAHPSTMMLKLWVRDWVNSPRNFDPPVSEWVNAFAKLPENRKTE